MVERNVKGQFAKGSSGNLAGRRPKDYDFEKECRELSYATFPVLEKIARGKPAVKGGKEPTPADILRAHEMLHTRAFGKPAAQESGAMFSGARIIVDTGIRRNLAAPTIDSTVVARKSPEADSDGK